MERGRSKVGSVAWEAFPRSGSTWISQSLRLAFPGYEQVSGEHRFSNLRSRSNLIVPVRNPLDSVSSWMHFTKTKNNSTHLLDWYIRFYKEVLINFSNLYVSLFDFLIKDVNLEMTLYSNKFDLESPKSINQYSLYMKMSKEFSDHIPSKERYYGKEICRKIVESSDNYSDARQIYNEVINACTDARLDS